MEREEGTWVKYLRVQQRRQAALEVIKNPACNVFKLKALQQQQQQQQQQQDQQQQQEEEANSTLIRYISACEALRSSPQLSLLPGFRQQQLETGQTAEDGFQVSRPGLRDRGLEVCMCENDSAAITRERHDMGAVCEMLQALRPVIVDVIKAGGKLLHLQVRVTNGSLYTYIQMPV